MAFAPASWSAPALWRFGTWLDLPTTAFIKISPDLPFAIFRLSGQQTVRCSKAAEGRRTPPTLARWPKPSQSRSVLECASPLALWHMARLANHRVHQNFTGSTLCDFSFVWSTDGALFESGGGPPHSPDAGALAKTLAIAKRPGVRQPSGALAPASSCQPTSASQIPQSVVLCDFLFMAVLFARADHVTESARQSGNIRYTVVRQASKWQQKLATPRQQTGNTFGCPAWFCCQKRDKT